ncbi:MAG: Gfo/Idh/MocA family oxidoreductase [Bacillota bacterium]|nr:Gfo/Idh/MocA family oxidoreductase [Bacillota bacterium]
MTIKMGILGFGFIGHELENLLSDFQEIELVALCDIEPEQMQNAKTPGIAKYQHMDDFFGHPDMDTVIIAIPNHLHKEAVIKAAKASKHILCEKPVALTVEELDEMEKAVQEAGVKFTVHHQRRFDPDFRTAKEIFDSKELGDVYTVQSMLYGINGNMHDWHVYKKFGGGMLYDWGVHLIDQILWMIPGKLKTVYADIRNVINKEVDDYFKILLRFENNIVAEIELGTYFLADKPNWFERHWFIGGNRGSAFIDGFKPNGKICTTSRLLENAGSKRTMTSAGPTRSFGTPAPGVLVTKDLPEVNTSHRQYFDNFVNAMRGEEDFLVKIPEVRRTLSVMEAVFKSGETGQVIQFE